MTKRVRMAYICTKCGQPGTYRYSYELAIWLKMHSWQGVVLCDQCMDKIDAKWREAKGASGAKNKPDPEESI